MKEEKVVKVSVSMPKKSLMQAVRLAKERDTSVSGVVRAGLRLLAGAVKGGAG